MCGYESSVTLTTNKLHYRLQTRTLCQRGRPRIKSKAIIQQKERKKKNLITGPKGIPETKTDRLTDRWAHQLNSVNQEFSLRVTVLSPRISSIDLAAMLCHG
jgi:hypothetical protein